MRHTITLAFLVAGIARGAAAQTTVTVTYDAAVTDSFTGRVYLMTGRADRPEPRLGPSWFDSQPFYALDVVGWRPGTPLTFDDEATGYPGPLSELPEGRHFVQAVMRRNPDSPTIGQGAGSAYSAATPLEVGPGAAPPAAPLRIDQVVAETPFQETDRVRLAELGSGLLSAFHGREITMRAAVILPRGHDAESDARYPAYYWIHGFGGDHHSARWMMRGWDRGPGAEHVVRIVPDPSCFGGHHVFADSANNGPRGRAFVEEFIPYLEKTFPLVAAPGGRFLGGHSSGGWSSLWLQVTYPEFFGGTWSVAPDPVDFTDFQRIDLYERGTSMYVDAAGGPRPIARRGDEPILWYRDFVLQEEVVGDGGQLRSFEWVFSPRGADGRPRPLFDRSTGLVDPDVAAAWKRYDIRRQLEDGWATLGPRLAGKLHVFMGGLDTFYLEGATVKLGEALDRLGSDAVIEIVPDADHGSISTPALRDRIDREILEAWAASKQSAATGR